MRRTYRRKVSQGLSDKGTLRDPSKMVSNSHRRIYAVIAVAALAFVGFTVYSVTSTPIQTPNNDDPLSERCLAPYWERLSAFVQPVRSQQLYRRSNSRSLMPIIGPGQ